VLITILDLENVAIALLVATGLSDSSDYFVSERGTEALLGLTLFFFVFIFFFCLFVFICIIHVAGSAVLISTDY